MVANVVAPPRSSRRTVLPRARRPKSRSSMARMVPPPPPRHKRGAAPARLRPVEGQAEGRADEDAHLLASDRLGGAVVPPAAARHHAPAGQFLDPAAEGAAGWDIVEHGR